MLPHPETYLFELAFRRCGGAVRSGPFAGMKYITESSCSALTPKLLGIYERELHSVIEDILSIPWRQIVDIGAAEGYYAVGFARHFRSAEVVAFEMNPKARKLLKQLAAKNDVLSRLAIQQECSDRELEHTIYPKGNRLILCDCEGAEMSILDPTRVPQLASCHILVETHEFVTPGVTATLRGRFSNTHTIAEILSVERNALDYPFSSLYTAFLPERYRQQAASEHRPGTMSWLWMTPRVSC